MRISDWSSDVCSSDLQNDYYVMGNVLTALASSLPFNSTGTQTECTRSTWLGGNTSTGSVPIRDSLCPYIDPNPVRSEARRVGNECVRKCRSRCSPFHEKKNIQERNTNT